MSGNKKTGILLIGISILTAYISGKEFLKMREPEKIIKGEGVVKTKKLSD